MADYTQLNGVPKTLLFPLACRAMESARGDGIIKDRRAEQIHRDLGGGKDLLLGLSGHDLFVTVMRVRQFDMWAREFLSLHPDGLVVDIGCGLDTRFERLDNGHMAWLGIDLPEVMSLRNQLLPGGDRQHNLACSVLDTTWLEVVGDKHKPTLFLAEGVFPYFSSAELRPVLMEMVRRFPGSQLVFDALSPFMSWFHNHTSPALKQSGSRIRWDVKSPRDLQVWGLYLLERWGYFDHPEPRLGAIQLLRYIPLLGQSNFILRYRLGMTA